MTDDKRPDHQTPTDAGALALDLVDHLDAMVAYWDADQVCVFANNAYRDWFGKSKAEMVGITLAELLGPIYPLNLPYLRAAYAGEVQVFEREIKTPDGRTRHSLATYTPHVVDGKVRGIFAHVADVTRMKLLEHELREAKAAAEQLATHDFLTGLPNRVLLIERISEALSLASRSNRMVAGLTLDLDNFKQINDMHGHVAGDRLLVQLADRLKRSRRHSATVTRMGGDEFFLLVPEVETEAQAEAVAARILAEISRPVDLGCAVVEPSGSIGIALASAGSAPEALIESSDRALYLAKKLGKNRVAIGG